MSTNMPSLKTGIHNDGDDDEQENGNNDGGNGDTTDTHPSENLHETCTDYPMIDYLMTDYLMTDSLDPFC